MKHFLALLFMSLFLVSSAFAAVELPQDILDAAKNTDQLILVKGTGGSAAQFTLYEKNSQGSWDEVIATPAFVGKNGLGKTREGDSKTPIGNFHFTMAFGIKDDPGSLIGYTKVDDTHYWDGDSNSKYYNQFVSTRDYNDFDKNESEHLIDYTMQYAYALNISYNEEGKPGLGSAIFLHCMGKKPYTGGCISIQENVMSDVMRRVKENCIIAIRDN